MEIDQLKSSGTTEDQMEMMMMMDKLPDFFGAYSDVAHDLAPQSEFPSATTIITSNNIVSPNAIANFIGSPHITSSPSFVSLPTSVPYLDNNTAILDEATPPFVSSSVATERWRGGVGLPGANAYSTPSQKKNSMAAMREMIFRIAAMQPIHIDPESVKPPKRRNVKISKDPQSVAARHRRERISERIRILQRLVPGGTKMDTASMLDEAIHYVKFLKTQVQSLERAQANRSSASSTSSSSSAAAGIGFPVAMSSGSYFSMGKAYQQQITNHHQNVQHYGDS